MVLINSGGDDHAVYYFSELLSTGKLLAVSSFPEFLKDRVTVISTAEVTP